MSSTHARSHVHSQARPTPTAPWLVVAAVIAGALFLCAALKAGSLTLLIIGIVVILAAAVYAVTLTRRGQAPVSFTDEFPEHTYGPRATEHGDSSPPIDTRPRGQSDSTPYQTMEEVDARQMTKPPDDRRAFPQYSNLSPDERLRNVEGREVIERQADDERTERFEEPTGEADR
jgi:hypothetical protein